MNCFSCCFRSSSTNFSSDDHNPPSLLRSSSTWIRLKSHELPEMKEKCKTLISRIGRSHPHRRGQSADFRYDPLSYALNFDEGNGDDLDLEGDEEFRYRNFSSRLPASPPEPLRPAAAAASS